MDLIVRLFIIVVIIYRNLYRVGIFVGVVDMDKDWSYNFISMLGYDEFDFIEFMRFYFIIYRCEREREREQNSYSLVIE